jgi:hypothetical protein
MEQYIPDESANGRAFRQWINQKMATSGAVPSASVLDQIINQQLSSAYRRQFAGEELAIQKQRLAESRREFDINTSQHEADMVTQSATGLLGTAAQIGTMYYMSPYLKKQKSLADYLGV